MVSSSSRRRRQSAGKGGASTLSSSVASNSLCRQDGNGCGDHDLRNRRQNRSGAVDDHDCGDHDLRNCRQDRSGAVNDHDFKSLSYSMGFSFASVFSQVLGGNSQGRMPIDQICHMSTSAVRESITNVHGDKLDSFIKCFEKSFESTLKTLHKINNNAPICQLENSTCDTSKFHHSGRVLITECNSSTFNHSVESAIVPYNSSTFNGSDKDANVIDDSSTISHSKSAPTLNTFDIIRINEADQESTATNAVSNHIIPHGQMSHQLAHISHGMPYSQSGHSFLDIYKRSVNEQARSNNLKSLELGLGISELRLKQSQLSIKKDANMLGDMKIQMGMTMASFEEEKFSNKMLRIRHAELLRTFTDILAIGSIIMCAMIAYGAYVFSYQLVLSLTSHCRHFEENKYWWMPNRAASFVSTWIGLKCHAATIRHTSICAPMVLIPSYFLLRRSSMSGATAPTTFFIGILGVICGFVGKLSVDAFGGNGNLWLIFWEINCMIHLFAALFPATCYHILYDRGYGRTRRARLSYTMGRYMFYLMLWLVYPIWIGLSPFASFNVWKEHFQVKLAGWR